MSEPSQKKPHTSAQVLRFIVALCFICALVLAVTAFSLQNVQQSAKDFDQSKQMLIAAKILNHEGYFGILQSDGNIEKARFDTQTDVLVADPQAPKATEAQIRKLAQLRIRPLLTDKNGNVFTLDEQHLTLTTYLSENKKAGYADLPLKLFYAILSNEPGASKITDAELKSDLSKISVFVIPVSGFGLWAPIYGFLAIGPDGDTVIGTTWYEHGETPGLGANITEPWWQKQFYGKKIFQETSGGQTDFQTTDMGITVVKGKVQDVFGSSPKAQSAVDGMSGATLTGNGVTDAFHNSLTPYRAFLIKVHNGEKK